MNGDRSEQAGGLDRDVLPIENAPVATVLITPVVVEKVGHRDKFYEQ